MLKTNRHNWYYLLGFGFLDYQASENEILLRKRAGSAMEEIAGCFIQDLKTSKGQATITIKDEDLKSFLGQHGVLTPKRYMPTISDEYAFSFIAGYFDGYGEFSFKYDNPRLFIQSPVNDVIDFISKHWKVHTPYADKIIVNGYKALDLCGMMYKNVTLHPSKLNIFLDVLNYTPERQHLPKKRFEFLKLHPGAVEPAKARVTDSGYDLHIIELDKLYNTPGGMAVYQGRTNVAIKPILGYAFDINGRSSLPKNGWTFLQGTGICDRSYTGGVEGTFLKLNDAPLPKMPWKALQIVPRLAPIHSEWDLKKSLGESDRGAGGFGSTN